MKGQELTCDNYVINCNNMKWFTEKKDLLRLWAFSVYDVNVRNSGDLRYACKMCVNTPLPLTAGVFLYSASSHLLQHV